MHVTIDGLVPIDRDHVLALVSIEATPKGGTQPLRWAAAHVWTVRDGRVARWETHLDLGVARRTLD
jgi:ketosteroid isomerase-like protein